MGLVVSISCAAIHDRFPKVVFVEVLCSILNTYFAAQEMELLLNILLQSSLLNENCPHVFAAQEKELPLNILCGSRLCCHEDFAHVFCRAGKGIAAEQQLEFHFWARLFFSMVVS